MDKYRVLQVIGEGTYGKVYKAQERESGRVVAIKKFKQSEDEDAHVRKTMMREIRILKEHHHDNIVYMIEYFRDNGKLHLIFDYVPRTLLEELQASPDGFTVDRIRSVIYQILKANNFLHEKNIVHRDIKPENLLISTGGLVKLCDFGFARPLNSSPTYQYTDYVSTRWYRAPELLVGDAAYSATVDTWSIGCIFAEIWSGMPLFPGDSDLHTLQLILETVTADDMEHEKPIQELSKKQRVAFRLNPLFEDMKVPLASEAIKSPDTVKEVSLKALMKNVEDTQLDFLRRCLVIDGSQRATLAELLVHPFFDEEFRNTFDAKTEEMKLKDLSWMQELMKTELKTKDGRAELTVADLITEEEDKIDVDDSESDDDDEDEDDYHYRDDSSSAVGTPESSGFTPASSSGIPPVKKLAGPSNQGLATEEGLENSIKTAAPPQAEEVTYNSNSMSKLLGKGSVTSQNVDDFAEATPAESPLIAQKRDKEDKKVGAQVTISERTSPPQLEQFTSVAKQGDSIDSVPEITKPEQNDQKEVAEEQPSAYVPIQMLKKPSLSLEEVREENNSDKSDKTSSAKASSVGKAKHRNLENRVTPTDHVILQEQVTTMFQDTPESSEEAPGKDYRQDSNEQMTTNDGTTQEQTNRMGSQQTTMNGSGQGFATSQNTPVIVNANSISTTDVQQKSQRASQQCQQTVSQISKVNITFGPNSKIAVVQVSGNNPPSLEAASNNQIIKKNSLEITPSAQSRQSSLSIARTQTQPIAVSDPLQNSINQSSPQTVFQQFSGKPIYTLQQYPQTQVKGPGPKQLAVLKQTSSVEPLVLDSRNASSPRKLPTLGDGLIKQTSGGNNFMKKINFQPTNNHASTQKKTSDQKIQPLKLVAFPKLSMEEQGALLSNTLVGNSLSKQRANTNNLLQKSSLKRTQVPQQQNQQQHVHLSSKIPKRYSELSMLASQQNNESQAQHQNMSINSKFAYIQEGEQAANFYPTPSRQSSRHNIVGEKDRNSGSVEVGSVRRTTVTGTNLSHQKSRTTGSNPTHNAGQSFTTTIKSKNNKFIQQATVNSSVMAGITKAMPSFSQGQRPPKAPPQTSEKKIHQHFLEEFSEMTSQRESLGIVGGNSQPSQNQSSYSKRKPVSLFTKSKFFQSNQSSNAENSDSLNLPSKLNNPANKNKSNFYGQLQQQQASPRPNQATTLDKNSFPRRNITNKLTSTKLSPPMNFYHKQRTTTVATTSGGVMLPNLNQPPQPLMQVSTTQLRGTTQGPPEQRNSINLSQSPNINRTSKKSEQLNAGGSLNTAVQLNASEFNLRLTNNNSSQLSGYQQIIRKQPSVIKPGRQHTYQMYMTPSQNYTSGASKIAQRAVAKASPMSHVSSNKAPTVKTETNWAVVKRGSGAMQQMLMSHGGIAVIGQTPLTNKENNLPSKSPNLLRKKIISKQPYH